MSDDDPPPTFLRTPQDHTIAYHLHPGQEPYIVFLCGFCSTMDSTKAIQLECWAREKGQGFLRLDYSGHGKSSGNFAEGCVGGWTDDVLAVLDATLNSKRILLVGSSMGAWVSFLVASRNTSKVVGLLGIASAPDFTEDYLLAQMTDEQKEQLFSSGSVNLPSSYSSAPYTISRKLIEDGRRHFLLRDPLCLPSMPIRLFHGTEDVDIDPSTSMRLRDHLQQNNKNTDVRLTLIPVADHRCSSPACLALIKQQLEEMLLQLEGV